MNELTQKRTVAVYDGSLPSRAAHGPQDHDPAVKRAIFLAPTCNIQPCSYFPLLL